MDMPTEVVYKPVRIDQVKALAAISKAIVNWNQMIDENIEPIHVSGMHDGAYALFGKFGRGFMIQVEDCEDVVELKYKERD